MYIIRCKDNALKFSESPIELRKTHLALYKVKKGTSIQALEEWVYNGYEHKNIKLIKGVNGNDI